MLEPPSGHVPHTLQGWVVSSLIHSTLREVPLCACSGGPAAYIGPSLLLPRDCAWMACALHHASQILSPFENGVPPPARQDLCLYPQTSL